MAEEVAKVYPELMVYGPDGKVQTVRYSMLSAMALNELLKRDRDSRRGQATVLSSLPLAPLGQLVNLGGLSAQPAQLKSMF